MQTSREYRPPAATVSLGGAWAGSSVNCAPFRHEGLVSTGDTTTLAWYDSDGAVAIATVVEDGRIAETARLPGKVLPFDAHRAISLARDGEGRLHLAYGAHSSPLFLARSRSRDLSAGFEGPFQMRGRLAGEITYPCFLHEPASGRLALLYRHGRWHAGEIHLRRFDARRDRWDDKPTILISGTGTPWTAGPYLNTPVIAPTGEITLFLVWRQPPDATAGGSVINSGIDCIIADGDLGRLRTGAGLELALPVTPSNAERVIAVPLGQNLMNQAGAALRPDGTPFVVTWTDDEAGIPQFHLGWRDGRRWRWQPASRFTTRFSLGGGGTLPLPHSRPELVFGADGTAHLIFRSRELDGRLAVISLAPPDYDPARLRLRILLDEDLGYYEPVIDRGRWRTGRGLAAYVQSCEQLAGGDEGTRRSSAEARFMVWHAGQFA